MSTRERPGNAEYELLRAALQEWRLCQDDFKCDVVLHITLRSAPARLVVSLQAFEKGQKTTGRPISTMEGHWPNPHRNKFEAYLFNTLVGFRRLVEDSVVELDGTPKKRPR